MIEVEVERDWRSRVLNALDRAERVYLKILRAMILVIATLMILFAAWLVASSLFKMSRSPASVKEDVATVAADELVDAETSAPKPNQDAGQKPIASPQQQQFYKEFVDRYYGLFRAKFEPFRQPEDKTLSRDEFDDSYVGTAERIEKIAAADLNFEQDSADLRNLIAVMTEAADSPTAQQRLQRYKSAKKMAVQNKVQRTRTEYRSGWNSYSTNCEAWYESPVGCPEQRAVQVPYTETVTSMEFPEGTQSHSELFRAFQNRYFELLGLRREANAAKAEAERNDIMAGKVEGEVSLLTALQIFGAFLVLMFFFLLIAIERHQRRMSAELATE